MLKKIDVLNALKDFSDEIPLEDLIERLLVIEKVSAGKKESDSDMVISEEQARYRLRKLLGKY